MTFTFNKLKYFLFVYFTPFPQIIHKNAIENGKLVVSDVASSLIKMQSIFWIANFVTITNIIIYKKNDNDLSMTCVNLSLLSLSSYMFAGSIIKTNYLLDLLELR